jgi:ribonuclease BN (tRNA processing enzyme)
MSTRESVFVLATLAATLTSRTTLQAANTSHTEVVLLGTGNPQPDPDRSGPSTAVVINGSAYLVDFGAGVVRRAKAAAVDKGVTALEPTNLRVAFVTHLHSDHTVGYPDLILTPWAAGRRVPLEVYGPKGIGAMTDHILSAYNEDIQIRVQGMDQASPEGWKVNVHEIAPGVVYKDGNVAVTAFPTRHGEWRETYGYRFDTADRSVVISGDTGPIQATIDACHGCDILIHEAVTLGWLERRPERRAYVAKYHTTTAQLAELAAQAKPRLLILYHNTIAWRRAVTPLASSPEELLNEVRSRYGGKVVVGRDLEVY